MKKFLSILIALLLLVVTFAATTAAIAEEPSAGDDSEPVQRTVTFNADNFRKYVTQYQGEEGAYSGNDFYLEMSTNFMFANKWWEDTDKVHEIFDGINYRYQPKDEPKDAEGNDKTAQYKVVYKGGDYAADNYNAPTTSDKYETEHFRLPAAPQAKSHLEPAEPVEGEEQNTVFDAYFAGWEITLGVEQESEDEVDGAALEELPSHLQGLFAANTEIAMPASDITITAKWVFNEDETSEQKAKDSVIPNDVIYVLYVNSNGAVTQDMQEWSRCLVTSTFSLTSEGEWNFRFAVVDGAKASKSSYTFDEDDILADTFDDAQKVIDQANESKLPVDDKQVAAADCTLKYRTMDTTHPQVDLSETQKNKQVDGLTVGTTYSVSSYSLSITDASSTTTTYVVYKQVGKNVKGADDDGWLLIFDDSTKTVTEGYENCISTSGVITPLEQDVIDGYVYKIVFSVTDAYGHYGVKKVSGDAEPSTEEEHPTLLLRVNPKAGDVSRHKTIEAWKIVLYVVAGLSFVGIIVLLCIKPKQERADARYNASNSNAPSDDVSEQNAANDDSDETQK